MTSIYLFHAIHRCIRRSTHLFSRPIQVSNARRLSICACAAPSLFLSLPLGCQNKSKKKKTLPRFERAQPIAHYAILFLSVLPVQTDMRTRKRLCVCVGRLIVCRCSKSTTLPDCKSLGLVYLPPVQNHDI